jgi:hypothetical protein
MRNARYLPTVVFEKDGRMKAHQRKTAQFSSTSTHPGDQTTGIIEDISSMILGKAKISTFSCLFYFIIALFLLGSFFTIKYLPTVSN